MGFLKDKVVVITGGASGIGRVSAKIFGAENATVIVWDLKTEKVSDEIHSYNVDVRNSDSVQNAANIAIEKFGKIDVLINNAGVTRDASLLKMSTRQWQDVLDVNLTGVFNCTKSVAPLMIEKKFGRIINTASVVGLYGNFGQSNYVASKAGVVGMTKVWARELGPKGITVNAVAPGFIATEMVKTIPENVLNKIIEKTPTGRLGNPEDVARVYLFLASEQASFINGAVISVDGGYVG
ncbi:beta-ketoacyl-ACP reductase [bacterium]|nr:MAG: beta-ketoacyl-ACP reductase [bacterium]